MGRLSQEVDIDGEGGSPPDPRREVGGAGGVRLRDHVLRERGGGGERGRGPSADRIWIEDQGRSTSRLFDLADEAAPALRRQDILRVRRFFPELQSYRKFCPWKILLP